VSLTKQIKVLFKVTWGEGGPADDHVSAARDCLLSVFISDQIRRHAACSIRKQREHRAVLTVDHLQDTEPGAT
jgi:hypothetical protein